MPESLDDKIAELADQKKKARAMSAIEALEEEGIQVFKNAREEEPKPSGFEKSTVSTTKAMHDPDRPELSELHSVIPKKVLSAVYEMHFIHKTAAKENEMMKKDHTVSAEQQDMNDTYVKIMKEGNEHIDRELSALDGSRARDAVENIRSLVAGEQLKNTPLMDMPTPGLWNRFKGLFASGKK